MFLANVSSTTYAVQQAINIFLRVHLRLNKRNRKKSNSKIYFHVLR